MQRFKDSEMFHASKNCYFGKLLAGTDNIVKGFTY